MLRHNKELNGLILFAKKLRQTFKKCKRVIKRTKARISFSDLKAKLLTVEASGKISTKELVNMIFDFCELYSGVTFYPYQEQFSKRLIRSVLDDEGSEITALFSRQSGKSETVATTVGGMMIILPKLGNMPMFANDHRLNRFKDGLWVGKQLNL